MSDDYFTIGQSAAARGPAGEVTVEVCLAGEFDIGARDELHDALINAVHTGDSVVVDLQQVSFIDSEAIGALLDGYTAAQHSGVSLRLANASGIVRRVMQVSGLLFLFEEQQPACAEDAAGQYPPPTQITGGGDRSRTS